MSSPNLFIIGFPKCGTTTLSDLFRDIEEVFVPYNKEPHIFNKNNVLAKKRLEQYKRQALLHKGKYFLDATPNYIKDISAYFDAMKKLGIKKNESKYIVCLRDPVDRYFSHYLHNYYRGTESRTIGQVIDEEIFLHGDQRASKTEYLDYSIYKEKIVVLKKEIKGNSVLFFTISDFSDPAFVLKKLSEFLLIDVPAKMDFKKSNSSYSPKSLIVNRILFSQSGIYPILRKFVPSNISQKIKAVLVNINRDDSQFKVSIDQGNRSKLKRVLSDETDYYEAILDEKIRIL